MLKEGFDVIPVGELIASVRYVLRDMQGASWSDFEIVEALNRGALMLYLAMAERRVHIASMAVELTTTDDGIAELPKDFHSVRHVREKDAWECRPTPHPVVRPGEYRIVGDRFEALKGTYTFEYYRIPPRVVSAEDAVDAPAILRSYLADAAVALLANDRERAEQIALRCCHGVAGGDLSRLTDIGPVSVWGGRA